jgi:hypothetical protein
MIIGRFKNKSIKILISAVFCLCVNVTGNAQLVELNLHLRPDTILIGERTELHLEIIKHHLVSLQAFPLKDSLNKEIEILDSLKNTSRDSMNLILHLTSFTPGQYKISRIPLVFSYENNTDTIFSPELLLTVISPEINNQAEIKDIKPPMNLPFRLREIIPKTGLVFGILLITILIIYIIIRRLRNKRIVEREEKSLPAHLFSLRALDRLKEEKLWQKGKTKEYYSRLSDIMRVYLEKRFSIPAMEYVSSETMLSFRVTLPNEEMLFEMLEGILQTADLVKFAKEDPNPAINQGNLDNAYLFIGQTKIEEITSLEEKIENIGKVNDNDKISVG